jgi:nucleotide-binding universal stress UspA family protein
MPNVVSLEGVSMDYQNLFAKIIVPLDGSRWAERAIPHAEHVARSGGSELILVHIYTPAGADYLGDAALANQTAHITQARKNAEDYVKSLKNIIASQNINVRTQLIEGSNFAALFCDYVNSEGADLVVMPTANTNRLMRVLLGDLTTQIRGCINACLLLVRGDMEAEWDEESRKALDAHASTPKVETSPLSMQLLDQLRSLYEAGILTAEEFEAKQALILNRL